MLLTIGPPILRIPLQCLRSSSRAFAPTTRRFYTNGAASSSQLSFHDETVKVGVGNNGHITLDILHPIVKGSPVSPRDAILYLPPGPLSLPTKNKIDWKLSHEDSTFDDSLPSPQHVLASKTLSTVITLNYRLSAENAVPCGDEDLARRFTFPTPVHDTLAGFDWIYRHVKPRRLCVYGANVGGSLALMLGLTEPRSVHAIVAEEPVCDWTGLDGYCLPPPEAGGGNDDGTTGEISDNGQEMKKRVGRKKTKKGPATAHADLVPLLEARRQFFRKPENYFDSFASPALFIRSAGKDCPAEFPAYRVGPEYPVPVLEKPPMEELEMEEELGGIPSRPVRRRKALSRWPPYGLDYRMSGERQILSGPGASRNVTITLPWVRLFVHSNKEDPEQKVNESTISDGSSIENGIENLNLDDPPSEAQSSSSPESKSGRVRARKRPTEAGLGEESVLAGQGVEMVSLLRAGCFFGREKGFREERVKLVRVRSDPGSEPQDPVVEQAGEWFYGILESKS